MGVGRQMRLKESTVGNRVYYSIFIQEFETFKTGKKKCGIYCRILGLLWGFSPIHLAKPRIVGPKTSRE